MAMRDSANLHTHVDSLVILPARIAESQKDKVNPGKKLWISTPSWEFFFFFPGVSDTQWKLRSWSGGTKEGLGVPHKQACINNSQSGV